MSEQKNRKIEFGDFQTPVDLAREVCALILRAGFRPAAIVEPTCGTGAFLKAAVETFPEASLALGFDINPEYVAHARRAVADASARMFIEVRQSDFFAENWLNIVKSLPPPVLVIGNPPWVTSAGLGVLGSNNLPAKSNLDRMRGIDALTGKSNFDISEWMLRKQIEWLDGRDALLAVLCKTAVARKTLLWAWQNEMSVESASLYALNARQHFGVSVDAGLLLVRTALSGSAKECSVFHSLQARQPERVFGFLDGMLVADAHLRRKWKGLAGPGLKGWRSGVKHDCNRVFELRLEKGELVNGLGEAVDLEPESLFPMLKSSDLAAGGSPRRWMIVSQRTMNDDPARLRLNAPKTWAYLTAHAQLLDQRKSSIYRNRPRFSVFGVGAYSFAPWKVAISGLYKKLEFVRVPPFQGRPVIVDDTCYFFPCQSEEECNLLYDLVMSAPAREFWSAFIFWDAMRPITAQLLNTLDLARLARLLNKDSDVARALAARQRVDYIEGVSQSLLWERESVGGEGLLVADSDLSPLKHTVLEN